MDMKEAVLKKANAVKGLNEFALRGEIVIFGSTYMANFPFYELTKKSRLENAIYNRSIEGMTLAEAKELLEVCVFPLKPSKLFLAFGEEEVVEAETAIESYREIVQKTREKLPLTKIYLVCGNMQAQKELNEALLRMCDGKWVRRIMFPAQNPCKKIEYKQRFEMLSSFFRDGRITMSDAFAMAAL